MTEKRVINMAAFSPSTNALGPGNRAAIWVQGCPFSCTGCISPEWREKRVNHLVSLGSLKEKILQTPNLQGLTISGGEPFLQASALAELIKELRSQRDLDVICFSGYSYESLLKEKCIPDSVSLLDEIDLLIDGRYEEALALEYGLRGSSNQRFIHLSPALANCDLVSFKRELEIQVNDGSVMLIGIPSRYELSSFNNVITEINKKLNANTLSAVNIP